MSNQQLKDILKQAHDRIKGVHASQTTAGSTGKDPGVDYDPKAGDEDDFVAKHSVERWYDRAGNKEDIYQGTNVKYSLDTPQNKRMGNDHEKSKKDYFVPVKEDSTYNDNSPYPSEWSKAKLRWHIQNQSSAADAAHSELKRRMSSSNVKEELEQIDELSKKTLSSYIKKSSHHAANARAMAVKNETGKTQSDLALKHHKIAYNRLNGINTAANKLTKEEVIDEVLTKKTSAGETIADFVHSKNPKFAGKSAAKRKQMALAAYYAKQNEEKEDTNDSHAEYYLRNVDKDNANHKKIVKAIGAHEGKFVGSSDKGAIVSVHKHKVYDFLKDMKMHGVHPDPIERFSEESVIECEAVEPLLGSNDIAKNKTDDTQDEIDMVRTELKAIANKVMHMLSHMPADHHIEPWVQSKIAASKEMIGSIHDYMMYSDKKPEDEQMDTPMTFPGMNTDNALGMNV